MPPTPRAAHVPLRRNRDFLLLQGGQLLSTLGSRSSSIAYPLLVLAITGSPAKAGVVSFARVIPFLLFSAFSGVAADRWNRKWLMIGADAVRAVALTGLVVPLALAWVLREPNVASAIVGASRPEQVEQNAAASGIELDEATLRAIDDAVADVVTG